MPVWQKRFAQSKDLADVKRYLAELERNNNKSETLDFLGALTSRMFMKFLDDKNVATDCDDFETWKDEYAAFKGTVDKHQGLPPNSDMSAKQMRCFCVLLGVFVSSSVFLCVVTK